MKYLAQARVRGSALVSGFRLRRTRRIRSLSDQVFKSGVFVSVQEPQPMSERGACRHKIRYQPGKSVVPVFLPGCQLFCLDSINILCARVRYI